MSLALLSIVPDDDLSWNVDPLGSLSRIEWEEAESFLTNCIHAHAVCRVPKPRFVPKRLLQVKPEGDSYLRLVERDDQGTSGLKYCALSYCWGSETRTLTTKRGNLEEHLKKVHLFSMPQVGITTLSNMRPCHMLTLFRNYIRRSRML